MVHQEFELLTPTKADELLTHVKKAIKTKDWKTAESEATAAIEANVLDSINMKTL